MLGFLLTIMYMTNAWDGVIYLALSMLIFLTLNLNLTSFRKPCFSLKNLQFKIKNLRMNLQLLNLIISSYLLVLSFIIFSLPFNRYFIPFAQGIGINCVTPNARGQVLCDVSPWWMLFILWGYFYYFAFSLLFGRLIPALKKLLVKRNSLKTKDQNQPKFNASDIFVGLMIFLASLLLIAPEFIFARDIYPDHYRANTMFKLGYQAFIMLGIVVAYTLFSLKKTVLVWKILAFVQLFLVMIYPFFGINSYYQSLKKYEGLDGLLWLKQTYPTDFAAVNYFRTHLKEFEQPVILEAMGDSYSDYARISAYTGLPTVIGWPVHEWLWRGSYDDVGKRQEEVKKMYESTNLLEVKNLLQKYQVKYVVVSTLERQKYQVNESNFQTLGQLIFTKEPTKIYQIN